VARTCATLQLWHQVVGKIRLTRSPWLNHSWHVALYVTARGLSTSPIPTARAIFEIEFDFIDHALGISTSDGAHRAFALAGHGTSSNRIERTFAQSPAKASFRRCPASSLCRPTQPMNCARLRNFAGQFAARSPRVIINIPPNTPSGANVVPRGRCGLLRKITSGMYG
jgi:hypothetical protein